jgi:hypothetical protein
MIRGLPRFAAIVAAAAASAALFAGTAHADEPVNRGGEPGEPGVATSDCRTSVDQQDGVSYAFCTATAEPGAPGPAVVYN